MAQADLNTTSAFSEPAVVVDLHCHSDASDGYFNAAVVADKLADAGVDYASLTDHHTVSGTAAFNRAALRRGVAQITGAELHALHKGTEVHLLAYGFEPHSAALEGILESSAVHDAPQVIDAFHGAGGIVFLAHPLQTDWSGQALEQAVAELAAAGLDGIEAFYKPYPPEVQQRLASMADRLGLLTSAGSDYHGQQQAGSAAPGVAMPVARWKQFRQALGDHARNGAHDEAGTPPPRVTPQPELDRINWQWLFLRIVVPSLLVIGAFIGLLFLILIPTMENRLLDRKREMTTELTNSAWSILWDYHREVEEGRLSLEQAQQAAIERIRRMRYGPDAMDYFWITDMHPHMVMHPYRSDLEGDDLTDFTDPDGVRLFVEFVAAVQNEASGFVRYVWQWQDDPDRLEAKESYVRRFAPWGWIIGTGLYVDDVQQEISTITGRMVDASFVVTVVATVLLLSIAYQSLKVERRRGEAEHELRLSHERYQSLVESSTSGTLLLIDGRCTYANRSLLEMLDYSASELAFLDIHDVVLTEDRGPAAASLELIAGGGEVREPFEARLRRKNGQTVPVLLSSTAVYFSGRKGMILSVQDITRHRAMQSGAARERLISQLQTSLLFLTEPVRNSMRPAVTCTLDASINQAVRLMNRHSFDAVAVTADNGSLVGIVTDHDIRERVVAAGLESSQPVSRIMSAPVVTIHENAPIFEAFLLERERSIDHLAVVDSSDTLVGIIRSSRTLQPDRYSPVVLTQQIHRARSVDELAECHQRLPALVGSLVDSGALPRNICHVTSAAADAVAQRIIALTLEELGPAPARFAFVALGSEARQEQTLSTDQDNALLYELREGPSGSSDAAADYFLKLGELVCERLDSAGYRYCKNEAMARDRRWNQPLERWKEYFSAWIEEPDELALAHCNVFFDLRCIYGDGSLVRALWQHVSRTLETHPAFLSHMALNTVRYKAPIGAFGKIVTGSSGEAPHTFNIKEAMLPIVNFARLYTLKHQLEDTNTFDRLGQLHGIEVLQEESYRAIYQAYEHLMQLRYRHQVEMIRSDRLPDNSIDPRSLTQIETGTLKNTFSQISLIQKKVSHDFHTSA
ncbi:MAG: CBS domain-containing protein [Spirochaetaceae bacterium]|nr:MAG: CBS domain-containing protein [Spirochaetaceae bacterium]